MAVVEAELQELESKLSEVFEQEDWSLPADGSLTVTPVGETAGGLEINMDLNTLGGSRPRLNEV